MSLMNRKELISMEILTLDGLKHIWSNFKTIIDTKSDSDHIHTASDVYLDDTKAIDLSSKLSTIEDDKVSFNISDDLISYKSRR